MLEMRERIEAQRGGRLALSLPWVRCPCLSTGLERTPQPPWSPPPAWEQPRTLPASSGHVLRWPGRACAAT